MITIFEISSLLAFICIGIDLIKPMGYDLMKWCFRICILACLWNHQLWDFPIMALLILAYSNAKKLNSQALRERCRPNAN